MFHYHTDYLAGGVGSTGMTRNQIAMQDQERHSCDLWCQEAEKMSRDSNTFLMQQKTLH